MATDMAWARRALLAIGLAACGAPEHDAGTAPPAPASSAATPAGGPVGQPADPGASCRAIADAIVASADLPGAPRYDERRIEILGRARGEPLVLLREPRPTPDAELSAAALASRRAFERGAPATRMSALVRRHRGDRATLRSLVLREGYVFTDEPLDALALVTDLKLVDLFDEEHIALQRGAEVYRLRREVKKNETTYRHEDGPLAGRAADVLFGDRVGVDPAELAEPAHRDLARLAAEEGFDRTRIEARTAGNLVAELRFGPDGPRARAVLDAAGARLSLRCIAEPPDVRAAVAAAQQARAGKGRALARLRDVVTDEVGEGMRFDRPEGETGPDKDGQLRPVWLSAYLGGRTSFAHESTSLPVFDASGRPWPPQVCVDFVLDSFERTGGTWFRPRGAPPGREVGRVDFDATGIANRRGVIAFGKFAEEHPDELEVRRFAGAERIPFRDRARFFAFLAEHADEVRAGDVVAIHGLKRDERVHQHAILVEATDPITGFPHGLADQMKRPRRRTWEGIMAEAPLRSLLFRVRLRPELWDKLDPGATPTVLATRR